MNPPPEYPTAERPTQWPTQALMAAGLIAGALFSRGKVGKMALAVAAGSVLWRSFQKHAPTQEQKVDSPRVPERQPQLPMQWPPSPQREIPSHWASLVQPKAEEQALPEPAAVELPQPSRWIAETSETAETLPAAAPQPTMSWLQEQEQPPEEPASLPVDELPLQQDEPVFEPILPAEPEPVSAELSEPESSVPEPAALALAEPDMSAVNWAIMAPLEPVTPAPPQSIAPITEAEPEPHLRPVVDWLQTPLFKEVPPAAQAESPQKFVPHALLDEAQPPVAKPAAVVPFAASAESFLVMDAQPPVIKLADAFSHQPQPPASAAWLLDVAPEGLAEEEMMDAAEMQPQHLAAGGDLPDVIEIPQLTAPVPLPPIEQPEPVAAAIAQPPPATVAVEQVRPISAPFAETEHRLLNRILTTEEPVARPPSTPLLKPILAEPSVASTSPAPLSVKSALTAAELTRAKQWSHLLAEEEGVPAADTGRPQPLPLIPRMRPVSGPLLSPAPEPAPALPAAVLPAPVLPTPAIAQTTPEEIKPSQDLKKTLPITLGPALQPLPDALAKLIPSVAQAGPAEQEQEQPVEVAASPVAEAAPQPVTPAAPLPSQPMVREIREELPADDAAASPPVEMPAPPRQPLSIRVALRERASQRLPGLTPIRLGEPREPSGPIPQGTAAEGPPIPDMPMPEPSVSHAYDRPANAAKTAPVRLVPRAPASDAADKKKQWLGWWK